MTAPHCPSAAHQAIKGRARQGPERAGRACARQRDAPPPELLADVVGVPAVPPQAWRVRQGAGARSRMALAQRAHAAAASGWRRLEALR